MVLITFLVLYLIVKKFFFEKIHDFMEAREQKVRDQFESAAAAERLAEEHLLEYNNKLDGIESERFDTIKSAKELADKRAQQIINEAEEKAQDMIRQAQIEIERERELFYETMKNQVAMLAIDAAEKIIEKQLDVNEQMSLVDGIIKQESEQWTH